MSIYSSKLDKVLLLKLSSLTKLRKGYKANKEPWFYSNKIISLPVLANFPSKISKIILNKIAVKKFKANNNIYPCIKSFILFKNVTRFVVPLNLCEGICILQNLKKQKLVYGNVYAISDTYQIEINDLGAKDLYMLIIDV